MRSSMTDRDMRSGYTGSLRGRTASRRAVLRSAGIAGVGALAAVLVGCGDDDAEATPAGTSAPGGSATSPSGGATAAPQTSDIKRGGTLRVAVPNPPSAGGQMDPHLGRGGGDHTFFWRLTESMLTVDDEFRSVPQLAESYERSDDLTVVFQLRPGIKFHDGSDLTSEVVRMNIARVIDPDGASSAYGQMNVIDSVETPDDLTVVLKTSRPDASILPNLADRGGQLLSGEQLQRGDDAEIARAPIGTGPFKADVFEDGSHVEFVANEGYWGPGADGNPLPYLDSIRLTWVEDAAVRATVVQTGDADISASIQGNEYLQLEADSDITTHLFVGTGTQHSRINLYQFDAPEKDVRVRQALMWSLDRQAIHDGAFGGVSSPAITPITPAHAWAYHKDFQDQIYEDLQRAKDLLSAAGYDDGYDIPLFGYNASTRLQIQLMQAQWERVGIHTSWEEMTAGNYTGGAAPIWNTSQYSIRPDPAGTLMEIWHSQGSSNAARQEVGPDWVGDAEMDGYLESAQTVFDLEERADFYHKAEEIMALDAHGIFMGWQSSAHAHRANVQDFRNGAVGKGRFNEVWLV